MQLFGTVHSLLAQSMSSFLLFALLSTLKIVVSTLGRYELQFFSIVFFLIWDTCVDFQKGRGALGRVYDLVNILLMLLFSVDYAQCVGYPFGSPRSVHNVFHHGVWRVSLIIKLKILPCILFEIKRC